MGGKGSGRPPSEGTLIKRQTEKKTPIATDVFLPNHSGVSSHPEFKSSVGGNHPHQDVTTTADVTFSGATLTGEPPIIFQGSGYIETSPSLSFAGTQDGVDVDIRNEDTTGFGAVNISSQGGGVNIYASGTDRSVYIYSQTGDIQLRPVAGNVVFRHGLLTHDDGTFDFDDDNLTTTGTLTSTGLTLATDPATITFGDGSVLDALEFIGSGTVGNQFKFQDSTFANEFALTLTSTGGAFLMTESLSFTSTNEGMSFSANTAGKEISFTSPVVKAKAPFEAGAATTKIRLTAIGGYAIKLTNKTGGNTVAGQLVAVYTTTAIDDAFVTCSASDDNVIGVVLDAGIADGSKAWIVVSGIADVLMDAGGSARGDRIISSATAGSGDVWNTGGAVATHFLEIGHCIETRTGAGLARCVLHFL